MSRKENSLGVLLRITAFRRMWLALSTSSLGDWLGLLATTALAAYLTRDASNFWQGAAVSGVLIFRLLPDLILGPIAGALVDKLDRRYVAIIGDTIAGLLYLSIPFAHSLIWLLIAQFLVEAVGLFSNPAKQALWVNIVPRERLAVANQLNYVSIYGMVPVAALLFALLATAAQFFGAPSVADAQPTTALISVTSAVAINIALVFDAATYFLAAGVLFATRRLIPAYLDEKPPAKSVFSLIREGVGFVKNSRLMRAIYVGILGAFAAGGLVAGVAQAYVATMGGGNAGYGILFGSVFTGLALGMLIGPKVLPAVPRRMVFTMGIGVAGVALVVMSLLQDFVGSAITSVVMGLFAGIAWITGFTMIGHEVADRLRGRVFAFVMSSVRIMLLGTLAAGPVLANSIGRHTVTAGEYRMVFTGPGIVLGASGLLTILVALYCGRQVGGFRGGFVLHFWHRLLRRGRRDLIESREALPGVLLAVVGPEQAATLRYADAVAASVAGQQWTVLRVDAAPDGALVGDRESDALRALADLADCAVHRLRPAVEDGGIAVVTGYFDAHVVRFGAQAGLGEERIMRMVRWSTEDLVPDLTILVDPADTTVIGYDASRTPAPAAQSASGEILGAASASAAEVATNAVTSYRDLAASAPERYVTVAPLADDGTLPGEILEQIAALVRTRSPRQVGSDAKPGRADAESGPVESEVGLLRAEAEVGPLR